MLQKLTQKSGGGIRLQKLPVFTSDANGGLTLRGAAFHHLSERDLVRYKGGFLQLVFSKPGYAGSSTFSPESVVVLKHEFRLEDLDRIASLRGLAQVRELREILGGEIKGDQRAFDTQIFQQASLFRSSLLERVKDPKSRAAAGQLLAMIGMPEDLRFFLSLPPPPDSGNSNQWCYMIATALFDPQTEPEWAFLRRCADNEFGNLWVDTGAIETLRYLASPKSLAILEAAKSKNPE